MSEDAVQFLIREVDDLLDAGDVGLYEFMWILKGANLPGTREQHLQIAQQALEHLLKTNRGRLISLEWAKPGTETALDREVRPEDFDDIQKGVPYVAIFRD